MGQVRFIAPGEPYEVQPGERLLQLANTGETPLFIGIRNGEYMIAAPASEPGVTAPPVPPTTLATYVLTQEQYVRLQQQIQLQPTYRAWIASGLLTLTELQEVPVAQTETPPPPPDEDEPEDEEPAPTGQDVLVEPDPEPVTEVDPPPDETPP